MPSWLAKAIAGWFRLRRLVRWNLSTSYGMAEIAQTRAIERQEVHPEAAADVGTDARAVTRLAVPSARISFAEIDWHARTVQLHSAP